MIGNTVDRYPEEQGCESDWRCHDASHPRAQRDSGQVDPDSCTLPTDDGTMPNNVQALRDAVIGRRIVSAVEARVPAYYFDGKPSGLQRDGLVITLDDGTRAELVDSDDCCAYTALSSFLLNPQAVDHVILGVGTEDGFEKWHIYADFGDVLTLSVSWSCGNPFYYGYGFDIRVVRNGVVTES